MNTDFLSSAIKQVLTGSGALLVMFAHFTAAQETAFINAGMQVGGGLLILASFAYSVYRNSQTAHAKAVSVAVGVPVNTPMLGKATMANYTVTKNALADLQKAGAANDVVAKAAQAS